MAQTGQANALDLLKRQNEAQRRELDNLRKRRAEETERIDLTVYGYDELTALMEEKGIKVAQPKGKAKAYAAASSKETETDWDGFEDDMAQLEAADDGWR